MESWDFLCRNQFIFLFSFNFISRCVLRYNLLFFPIQGYKAHWLSRLRQDYLFTGRQTCRLTMACNSSWSSGVRVDWFHRYVPINHGCYILSSYDWCYKYHGLLLYFLIWYSISSSASPQKLHLLGFFFSLVRQQLRGHYFMTQHQFCVPFYSSP